MKYGIKSMLAVDTLCDGKITIGHHGTAARVFRGETAKDRHLVEISHDSKEIFIRHLNTDEVPPEALVEIFNYLKKEVVGKEGNLTQMVIAIGGSH